MISNAAKSEMEDAAAKIGLRMECNETAHFCWTVYFRDRKVYEANDFGKMRAFLQGWEARIFAAAF